MLEFITRLRRRWQEPSVYAIYLNTKDCKCWRLHMSVDYSLEKAINGARKAIGERCGCGLPFLVGGWTIMTYEGLIKAMTVSEIKTKDGAPLEEAPPEAKNELMRLIVETNDVKLFEECKPRLTPADIAYLEDKLNRK